jgi:very-short-patch-repair endonuclease
MSQLESTLAFQLRVCRVPAPEREYVFAPPRRWRFDFAWPERKLAVEVEGGMWAKGGGRHQRGKGFEADCEKYNAAALAGWMVLRVTEKHVHDGQASRWIERALAEGRATR